MPHDDDPCSGNGWATMSSVVWHSLFFPSCEELLCAPRGRLFGGSDRGVVSLGDDVRRVPESGGDHVRGGAVLLGQRGVRAAEAVGRHPADPGPLAPLADLAVDPVTVLLGPDRAALLGHLAQDVLERLTA